MTRRTVFFGVVDLPVDPFLLLLVAALLAVNIQGPAHQVSRPGEPLVSDADVSWLSLGAQALLEAGATFAVVVLVVGGLRAAYRALGDPAAPREVTAPD